VSTYQQAGVEQLAPGQVATIEIENPTCVGKCVNVVRVDGKLRGIGWFGKFELVPGSHEITCIYLAIGVMSHEFAVLRFTAEAGHTYRIRPNVENMTWHPEIVDGASGQTVSQLTGFTSE
jgi:hypothetical protein